MYRKDDLHLIANINWKELETIETFYNNEGILKVPHLT